MAMGVAQSLVDELYWSTDVVYCEAVDGDGWLETGNALVAGLEGVDVLMIVEAGIVG